MRERPLMVDQCLILAIWIRSASKMQREETKVRACEMVAVTGSTGS